jgi:hypothetical protein
MGMLVSTDQHIRPGGASQSGVAPICLTIKPRQGSGVLDNQLTVEIRYLKYHRHMLDCERILSPGHMLVARLLCR